MRPIVSLTQAAQALGVPVELVRSWIDTGVIRARQAPTGFWQIPESEVQRLRTLRSIHPQRHGHRTQQRHT